MPRNTPSIDSVVQELQDRFNEEASMSVRSRASLEADIHENDWILVNVFYNEKSAEIFKGLEVDSLSSYLLRRNNRGKRWDELHFSSMPGGPFQSFAKDDVSELLAIRSIFFMKNNGIGGDIREMPFVQSVELLGSGKPVHDMVIGNLKKPAGPDQALKL